MSSKGIYEADGKKFLATHLKAESFVAPVLAHVAEDTDLEELPKAHPWLLEKVSVCYVLYYYSCLYNDLFELIFM